MVSNRNARVAICIGTFERQELLRQLLSGISQLTFHKARTPDIEIIVVDNDPLQSAREVCAAASVPWPIKYVTEAKRGITYVRNRALAEAGSVDFIAFIDDDEV